MIRKVKSLGCLYRRPTRRKLKSRGEQGKFGTAFHRNCEHSDPNPKAKRDEKFLSRNL